MMISDLRERIVAAIREVAAEQVYWVPGPWLAGVYADAVIDALGITVEFDYGTSYPKVPLVDQKYVRFVSRWEPCGLAYCMRCGVPHEGKCLRDE